MTNLWVHSTIGQYPICHNDATSHNTDVIDQYSQQGLPPETLFNSWDGSYFHIAAAEFATGCDP